MDGYMGVIEAQMATMHNRIVALERAAGDALTKAKAEIAAELYKAQHPGESDATTAAKKALDELIAEGDAKKAELSKALADAEAADAEAAKPIPGEVAGEPAADGMEPMPIDDSPKKKGKTKSYDDASTSV